MERQQRAEETRSHLLQAAEECFARLGYDATGVAEICARAGVSKGAFYHHFPSKQAVFLALLDRWLGELDLQMVAARERAANFPETLESMAGVVERLFDSPHPQLPMFL